MTDAVILSRLRRFLLVVSALLLAGTLAELWLTEHTESFVQLIPFALCGTGLLALTLALLRPRRASLVILRACALLLAAGALFGVYEHVTNNVAFRKEIDPAATAGELLWAGLGGANPLLAPATLLLAATLALAATYRHPALSKNSEVKDQ